MKKKLSPRQWLGAVVVLLLFIILTLFIYGCFHEDARFEKFINKFFVSELSSNPITLHYTLMDASKYGIDESSLTLPVYHAGQLTETLESIDETLITLKKFRPKMMSDTNKYAYVLLSTYLTAVKECSAYLYFDEPLSPSSGVQSELPILLAEYRISSTEDIENYFSILSQIPQYLDGIILYEQEKAEHGLFMSDTAADKLIEQCVMLMNPNELKEGTHFLEVTFKERLDKLVTQNLIDESKSAYFQSANERLLTTLIAPAYDKLADELTLLKGRGGEARGLACYPNGKEYYQAALRLTTGSYHSIDEIKGMLSFDFEKNYTALLSLLKEYPALGTSSLSTDIDFPALTAESILSELSDMMKADYPEIPYSDGENTSYSVKYVADALAPYTAPAFYMTPPIDDSSENVIYINTTQTTDGLSLFTTLAHEGYPGHLYQTVYSHHKNDKITAKVQSILNYSGYVEGWAMYTELNSFDYAIELSKTSHPESEYVYTADKLNRQIQLCIYSILDIIIHYEGASYERVCEILKAMGFTDEEGIRDLYEYIVEEPCNYLKYYLGYLEIMELKGKAEASWGSAYTPNRFHAFILNNGPADYRTLERLMSTVSYGS
ncbi:MAG: DUF885 domain-containing protein [Lachnospiraceae bacterium]|nr:DUF885 domain-containing protein [Lachnospiraceae bacterium]